MTESDKNSDNRIHRDKLSLLEMILPGVAHEINNKNQTILLTTQIILEVWEGLKAITDRYFAEHGDFTAGGLEYSLLREELAGYCTNVFESAKNIDRIVSEIRSFARSDIESGSRSLNLNRLIEGTVTLLANPIHKATDHLILELDPTLPEIPGNPKHIAQVLLHLVLNACLSLSDKKSKLTISTRRVKEKTMVVCEVRDQGSGMAVDEVALIHRYLVGDEPHPDTPEEISGGWEAIRSIVLEHGGSIDLHSEVDHGTRVVLEFPVQVNRS